MQLENGVGMIRLFQDELEEALRKEQGDERERRVSMATSKKISSPLLNITLGKIKTLSSSFPFNCFNKSCPLQRKTENKKGRKGGTYEL
mgnify:CR=1 FL=1